MKKFFLTLLAGILTLGGFGNHAAAQSVTAFQCVDTICDVEITVVNDTMIVANPQILVVASRHPNNERQPVFIRYTLNTPGYSFNQGGIAFANPSSGQFGQPHPATPAPGGAPRIMVADFNSDLPPLSSHKYGIMVKNKANGNVLELDPVIINGGPLNQ